jgi:hypothetical protein
LIWIPLPETSRRIKTLRHRPCDGTPNAATVSVTTGRVELLISKNIVFYFHTPRCGLGAVHGDSEALPLSTATVAAGETLP